MRRLGWSRLASVCAGASFMATASVAAASSGLDSPESGVEQVGRGSAWLARATDPLDQRRTLLALSTAGRAAIKKAPKAEAVAA